MYQVWKNGLTDTVQIYKGDNLVVEFSHDEYVDLKQAINNPSMVNIVEGTNFFDIITPDKEKF